MRGRLQEAQRSRARVSESSAFTPQSSPEDTAGPALVHRLCPASSWALGSGFALELKVLFEVAQQRHEFLSGVSQVHPRRPARRA